MKKNQVLPVILFALLTVASVKTAPAAPPPSDLADAPDGAEISLENFLCDLSRTTGIEFPDTTPVPTPTAVGGVCGGGGCSPYSCANKNVGAPCNPAEDGIGWGWCLVPWAELCSDGSKICRCLQNYP